ncbi:MAG: glycosyltransferase family 77 protein [Moorea sp. SIO3G5]|nr:glycosyltransferase family 77 protein [Moorena sp. SIO3G5]
MNELLKIKNQTFIFSIATNGYDEIYKDYLTSHQNYANKHGYKYIAFTKSPPQGISGTNSAWLKVAIILNALKKGYQNVFFIDSDALIRDYTPEIESVFCPNKFIYMSVESSGNFNSGVIIVINTDKSIKFFNKLLLRADLPNFLLPKSDRCLYENGHVINLAKKSPIVQIISPKWNYNFNTVLPENEKEYILHGRGSWNKKPRSQEKPLSLSQALLLKLTQGSRYFTLKRLLNFYKCEYNF